MEVGVWKAYTRLLGNYVKNALSLSLRRKNMRVDEESSFKIVLAILMYDRYIYDTPTSMHNNLYGTMKDKNLEPKDSDCRHLYCKIHNLETRIRFFVFSFFHFFYDWNIEHFDTNYCTVWHTLFVQRILKLTCWGHTHSHVALMEATGHVIAATLTICGECGRAHYLLTTLNRNTWLPKFSHIWVVTENDGVNDLSDPQIPKIEWNNVILPLTINVCTI